MEMNDCLLLSVGTNHLRKRHMTQAMSELQKRIDPDIVFTSIIETEAVGIDSLDFLNCLAMAHTERHLDEVKSILKSIECNCGNTREKRLHNCVEMDIDVLQYHGVRHHEKDWSREYVVKLMKELKENQ